MPRPDGSAKREWTVVRGDDSDPRLALAIRGDWTFAGNPLAAIARLVQAKLDRAAEAASLRRSTRLLHRMMRQLARVDGAARIGDTVLRYAAAAVGARVGAMAITAVGQDRASIVATFGYPLVLVEHMQIEPGAGVIGTVLQSGRPIRETGLEQTLRVRRPRYRTNSYVAVPILTARETLGALCVTDKRDDGVFSARDAAALRMFAAGAALALARERALRAADVYAHAAAVDPVTNLFNRRYFQVRLDEELQRSKRHQIPIALLLIDVDDFKAVNDSFGHLAGDVVLRDLGEILRGCVRVFDVCARFGGEEFVIIMPGGTKENAFRIAERIRRRVEAYRPSELCPRDLADHREHRVLGVIGRHGRQRVAGPVRQGPVCREACGQELHQKRGNSAAGTQIVRDFRKSGSLGERRSVNDRARRGLTADQRGVEPCADSTHELTGIQILRAEREATADRTVYIQLHPVLRPRGVDAADFQPPRVVRGGENPAVQIEEQLVGGGDANRGIAAIGAQRQIARRNELAGHETDISNLSAIVQAESRGEKRRAITRCSRPMRLSYTRVISTHGAGEGNQRLLLQLTIEFHVDALERCGGVVGRAGPTVVRFESRAGGRIFDGGPVAVQA